jgi:hypothetical protein
MKKIISLTLAGIFFLNLSAFAVKDQKGTVTKEAFIKQAEKEFTRMDVNNDGKLTPDERKAYRQAKKLERQQKKEQKKS